MPKLKWEMRLVRAARKYAKVSAKLVLATGAEKTHLRSEVLDAEEDLLEIARNAPTEPS